MAIEEYPSRVRFFDGQFLQAQDLTDEQSYHLLMRWRHNLAMHSWGIVTGLPVSVQKGGNGLFAAVVQPGMAFDGYGRELVLVNSALTTASLIDPNATYDVLISYGLPLTSSTTSNGSNSSKGCSKAQSPNRALEQPSVWVTKTSSRVSSDPSAPGEVPTGDLDFSAEQLPPDDPNQQWPVLLGRISFQTQTNTWTVDTSVRRYAGLIADRIASPPLPPPPPPVSLDTPSPSSNTTHTAVTQQTVLLTGSDPALSQYRFAVLTLAQNQTPDPDATPPFFGIREIQIPDPSSTAPAAGGTSNPPIPITTRGHQIEFRTEQVAFAADMVFQNGSVLQFQQNPVGAESNHKAPVTASAQWRMYHHFQPPPQLPPTSVATGTSPRQRTPPGNTSQSPTPSLGFSDELRITIPASTTPPTTCLSIGCYDNQGQYNPILVVSGDKSVVVYGNLSVQGNITQGLITTAPGNQTVAVAAMNSQDILVRAGNVFNTLTPEAKENFVTSLYSGAGRDAINSAIKKHATKDDIAAFAPSLWSSLDNAQILGQALAPTSPPLTSASPGATAARLAQFLAAMPSVLVPDPPNPTQSPAQVVGNWLASKGGDDGATSYADGITQGLSTTKPTLTTLIKQLIADGAATEMIDQLSQNNFDEMVSTLFNQHPEAMGKAKVADGNDLTGLLNKLLTGLFSLDATDHRAQLLAQAIFDYSWTGSGPADIDPNHNRGNIAVAAALNADLPKPPFQGIALPPSSRLCRFLTYVLLGNDPSLLYLSTYLPIFSQPTKLPAVPPTASGTTGTSH